MVDFIFKAIFEWDQTKDHLDQYKHGVSFEEARHACAVLDHGGTKPASSAWAGPAVA